jgi:hypothetical protein
MPKGGGLNIFAFVEFRHPEEAAAAINAEVSLHLTHS